MNKRIFAVLLVICALGCVGTSFLLAYEESLDVELELDEQGNVQPVQVFPFPIRELNTLFFLGGLGIFVIWILEFRTQTASSSSHP